ncbi:MAG: type 1 periplasmic binding fold superfamily protein [Cytophagales bacterium]|nr:MAG: type 1 periplasmic binding fold superfamily protein [Cytophagales bacterium]TAF61855.1 MAG: type 1 periplasmic binding fold superfamily protein [Cytophagales bacterium]
MLKLKSIIPVALLAVVISFGSCKKDEHNHGSDQENLTTLKLIFKNKASGVEQTFVYADKDGVGGNNPTQDPIILADGANYDLTLQVLDESGTTAKDITPEIITKGEEHQFFFTNSSIGTLVNVKYEDKDAKNNPIGVKNTLTSIRAGKGKFRVSLRHEPNKSAAGVKDGQIANAGGETDIEADFDISVL